MSKNIYNFDDNKLAKTDHLLKSYIPLEGEISQESLQKSEQKSEEKGLDSIQAK